MACEWFCCRHLFQLRTRPNPDRYKKISTPPYPFPMVESSMLAFIAYTAIEILKCANGCLLRINLN